MKDVTINQAVLLQGLKELILKRLGKTDWRTSRTWVKAHSSMMYQSERIDGGYRLLVGVRWRRGEDGKPVAAPVARITTDDNFIPQHIDFTAPSSAGTYVYQVVGNVVAWAWHAYFDTATGKWANNRVYTYRAKAPKFVFLDPTHPAVMGATGMRAEGKRFLALKVRQYSTERAKWEDAGVAMLCHGKWVRWENGAFHYLDPLELSVARCDFSLARRNGKALRSVESTIMATSRITGLTVGEVVRNYVDADNNHGLHLSDLQHVINEKGEDLHPEEVAFFLKARSATKEDVKRFDIPVPENYRSRWARPKVPVVHRPTPATFDDTVTVINSLEELNEYAEANRGA